MKHITSGESADVEYDPKTNAFKTIIDKIYFHRLPSYGNHIFFSLGFLALTSLSMLVVTGITLAFMGQAWWLHTPLGIYVRSAHLWSVQFFIFILVLHIIVGFSTSGFRAPRRMVWVFGAFIFALALIQTEFGYGLRGDFSSQYRAVSGADFWNGAHLGYWLNPLNHAQEFAIHVIIIPLFIFVFFLGHYILEHTYGVSRPARKSIRYKMVDADHTVLFVRGGVLVVLILGLALFFHSPYVPKVTIAGIAQSDPVLVMNTLQQEFKRTSDTATYFDSIDPYQFDTRQVFIVAPYQTYVAGQAGHDAWTTFTAAPVAQQQAYIAQADRYMSNLSTSSVIALMNGQQPVAPAPVSAPVATTSTTTGSTASSTTVVATTTATSTAGTAVPSPVNATSSNPVVMMYHALLPMTKSGLYEKLLNEENPTINDTYSLRFLNDMGVLDAKADSLNMDTEEWGMAKDETGSIYKLPPGSWWLLPLAIVNTAFNLLSNDYGDQIAGEILGSLLFLFIIFPYIPYVNRLPEYLPLAPLFQHRSRAERRAMEAEDEEKR